MRVRNVYSTVAPTLALALTVAGCGGSDGAPEGPAVVPGRVVVELETPNGDDGAAVIYVRGPGIRSVTAVTAEHQVFTRSGGSVLRVVIVGDLEPGPILSLDVHDVSESFGGTVVEVADRGNVPRSPAQYNVRFRPANEG
jgi:hypothetical protein